MGLSAREIGSSVGISHSSVLEFIRRAAALGLQHPLPEGLTQDQLEAQLYPSKPRSSDQIVLPDWGVIHQELKRKHVTLDLLWREYKAIHPQGIQYSAFCEHYRKWSAKLNVSMRQQHEPGHKMFVDYAGTTIEVVDGRTGEVRAAQLFVAVLGASNYTFAEATWTQTIADWIGSHVRTLNYFGASPRCVVPDNLRSGVTKPLYFEPTLNETYADWARHYGIAILPARPFKPKDKAKVEGAVLIAERWIIAALRNERFFSLHELNRTIAQLLERLNTRAFKKLPGCRQSAFDSLDKPQMLALPSQPYEFADWQKRRVGLDYHVEVKGHYYSVPYQHAKAEVMARIGDHTVELFLRGQRIASHVRKHSQGRHTTAPEHMPINHRCIAEWTPEKFRARANKIGPRVLAVVEHQLGSRKYPEQAYRACLGILRLAQTYGVQTTEAACELALRIGSPSYTSISSILKTGKAAQQAAINLTSNLTPNSTPSSSQAALLPEHHANVRGPDYYH